MTINDCILITQRLLEKHGLNPESNEAHELWGRHFDNWDEDEFMTDLGWTDETIDDDVFEWMLNEATEYYHSEGREPKVTKLCKKYITAIWHTAEKHVLEKHSLADFKFIEKIIAKTLPEGTQEMTWSSRSGRTSRRVIKGGKWVRG